MFPRIPISYTFYRLTVIPSWRTNVKMSTIIVFHINYLELHETCNLLTVEERIKYFYLILAFKSTRTNSTPGVKELFKFGQSSRNRTLILPSHKTKFYEKSPMYMSMTTWNTLCLEAKEADLSLCKFTKIINQWLISNRLEEFVST